jgi:hypothetical protein
MILLEWGCVSGSFGGVQLRRGDVLCLEAFVAGGRQDWQVLPPPKRFLCGSVRLLRGVSLDFRVPGARKYERQGEIHQYFGQGGIYWRWVGGFAPVAPIAWLVPR